MLAVTADNQREIEAYRHGGRSGGTVMPSVAEIRSQRREYEYRLKIVGPLYHKQVTTAIITEHLIKAIPPGVMLKGLEIKNGSLGEAAAGGKKDGKVGGKVSSGQTISISGTSLSLEPLGIYLSGLQNLPTLTDILLKEAVWDNSCYSFVIMAVVVTP
jgi:Tfp pilus assembly protein PilN